MNPYVTGEAAFYGRIFHVTPDVLIPRFETEVLVQELLRRTQKGRVLEIGTGSGNIAITLACECPEMEIVTVDCSGPALAVARLNWERLGGGSRVQFVESDALFDAVQGEFDVFVSNPPYLCNVPEEVDSNVCLYEPHIALFPPDPLYFYRLFAKQASARLIALEVPHERAYKIQGLFSAWQTELINDLTGRPRVLMGGVSYGLH